MDRDYKTGKSDSVGVFSGLEIEHTPAFGKQHCSLARNDLLFDQIEDRQTKVNAKQYILVPTEVIHAQYANTNHNDKLIWIKVTMVTIDYPHSIHE